MEKLEFGVQRALRGLMQINGGGLGALFSIGHGARSSGGKPRVRVIWTACLCAPEHNTILPGCSNTVRSSMPQHALQAQMNRMHPASRLAITCSGAAL